MYGSTVCKCPISSQTINYRYKFKANQIFFLQNACMAPPPLNTALTPGGGEAYKDFFKMGSAWTSTCN